MKNQKQRASDIETLTHFIQARQGLGEMEQHARSMGQLLNSLENGPLLSPLEEIEKDFMNSMAKFERANLRVKAIHAKLRKKVTNKQ